METKVCTKCREEKEIERFYKNSRKKDGLNNQCKLCDAEYRYKNRDKLRDYAREYRTVHREKLVQYLKMDRVINKEKRRLAVKIKKENHPDLFKLYSKVDYEKNKERYFHNNAKRRARCKNATPKFADRNKIRDIYRLASTMTKITGVLHHVDHIIPLRGKLVSGLHVEWNLQVIPAKENLKKHNKVELDE